MGPGGDEVGAVGVGESEGRHLLDVGAGGEGFVGAGEDDGADGGRGGSKVERAALSSVKRGAERAFRALGRLSVTDWVLECWEGEEGQGGAYPVQRLAWASR